MAEPDMLPHYWTILIDKVRMLDDGQPRPICQICNNSFELFEFEGEAYCNNEYGFKREIVDGAWKITSITKKSPYLHFIGYETLRESLHRVLNMVFDRLEEVSGARFDLMDLETFMFRVQNDDFFETKYGDMNKATVQKLMYNLKKIIMDRMMELRREIRFTSMMRTPSIKMM